MKKVTLKSQLIFTVLFSLLLFSCSEREEFKTYDVLTKPRVEVLWDSVGERLLVKWNNEKERLKYKIYVNGIEVGSFKEDVHSSYHNFIYEIGNNLEFPLKIMVAVSRNGDYLNSNEIEVEDPILGKWLLEHTTVVENGGDDAEILMPVGCEKNTSNIFKEKGFRIFKSYTEKTDGSCEEEISEFKWKRIGVNKYEFVKGSSSNVFNILFYENTMQYKIETANELFVYSFKNKRE